MDGSCFFLDGNDGQRVYIDEYEASLVTFWCTFCDVGDWRVPFCGIWSLTDETSMRRIEGCNSGRTRLLGAESAGASSGKPRSPSFSTVAFTIRSLHHPRDYLVHRDYIALFSMSLDYEVMPFEKLTNNSNSCL
jgi:hypothetical protein